MVRMMLWIAGCTLLVAAVAAGCKKKDEGTGGTAAGQAGAPTGEQVGAPAGADSAGACLKKDELAGPSCDEQLGFPADQLAVVKDLCVSTAGARWIDGPCPRENATGACSKKDATSNTEFNNWYYADSSGLGTPEDVQKLCADNQLEFLAP
ncbi:MAG: hypothetical protein HY905_08450 [Deltaproteobacteria bacterium]|nr:hypothetical protein [Deltaproteobacteria bacterium]